MKARALIFSGLLLGALLVSACGGSAALGGSVAGILDQPTSTPAPVEQGALNALESLQEGFAGIYERVAPSVVHVRVVQTISAGSGNLPGFGMFPFNLPGFQSPKEYKREGTGSGFVWDKKGHIITNNHVVEGADEITVTFSDGTSEDAEVVGRDVDSDLAVIKVKVAPERLHPIQMADSTQLKVGDLALAIGNPFGLQGTMTVGIVSALGRSLPAETGTAGEPSYTIPDVIQTDAPINPGNSGGVLVDINGKVLGVTAAIESPVRASAGIGFVIPSIIVQKIAPVLIEKGHYEHPRIGISGRTLDSKTARQMGLDGEQRGALVVDVSPGSPAEAAGLKGSDHLVTIDGQETRVGGDVIISIDGQPVTDFEDVAAYLARYTEVGDTITLRILRDGKEITIDLTLAAREAGESAAPAPKESEQTGQAWLGILGVSMNPAIAEAMELPKSQTGVLIQQIYQDGPADKAGLRGSYMSVESNGQTIQIGGDIIVALDGDPIEQMPDLQAAVSQHRPGDQVVITILRAGEELEVEVLLEER